jgi:hypothetical protein
MDRFDIWMQTKIYRRQQWYVPRILLIVFHPLTYEGTVEIETISDPLERQATEL